MFENTRKSQSLEEKFNAMKFGRSDFPNPEGYYEFHVNQMFKDSAGCSYVVQENKKTNDMSDWIWCEKYKVGSRTQEYVSVDMLVNHCTKLN